MTEAITVKLAAEPGSRFFISDVPVEWLSGVLLLVRRQIAIRRRAALFVTSLFYHAEARVGGV